MNAAIGDTVPKGECHRDETVLGCSFLLLGNLITRPPKERWSPLSVIQKWTGFLYSLVTPRMCKLSAKSFHQREPIPFLLYSCRSSAIIPSKGEMWCLDGCFKSKLPGWLVYSLLVGLRCFIIGMNSTRRLLHFLNKPQTSK